MNNYIAMWDMYGLEMLFDVTDWSKKVTWATLKEEPVPGGPNLQLMILRARTNSQRCYEIYSFNAESNISEQDIKSAFKDNPQPIVDFIRKNGEKIYSDRSDTQKQVIV